MPFGLKNAAQAFQRLMDGILRDIDSAFVYLDDILIASPDEKTHMQELRNLFALLSSHSISINRKKCMFGQSQVKYLDLGLRMVKELDLQLALGMNERRKTGSLPVYDMHRWGVGGSNLGQTQS